jgi:deoxycytidine triphosphate deaminase
MSIKSDKWIRRMAQEHGMIEPFVERQVRGSDDSRVISYGVSSYGYDVRCANHFKVFTNINSAIVDPKNFDAGSFRHPQRRLHHSAELLRPGQHRRVLPHSAQRADHLPG